MNHAREFLRSARLRRHRSQFARFLSFEYLEKREVFASGVTALSVVNSPIYEGGVAYPGSVDNSSVPPANAAWAKLQYTVTIDANNPGSLSTNQKVQVRITGDSDAFAVDSRVTRDTAQSTSTLYVGTLATSFAQAPMTSELSLQRSFVGQATVRRNC